MGLVNVEQAGEHTLAVRGRPAEPLCVRNLARAVIVST